MSPHKKENLFTLSRNIIGVKASLCNYNHWLFFIYIIKYQLVTIEFLQKHQFLAKGYQYEDKAALACSNKTTKVTPIGICQLVVKWAMMPQVTGVVAVLEGPPITKTVFQSKNKRQYRRVWYSYLLEFY